MKYAFVPDIFKVRKFKRKEGKVKETLVCPFCGYEVDPKKDCCKDGSSPNICVNAGGQWYNSYCHKKCFYIVIKGCSDTINNYKEDYMLEAL